MFRCIRVSLISSPVYRIIQACRMEAGHVFRQRAAKDFHALKPDGPAVAAIRSGREEKQLAAALAPKRDQFRESVGGSMVGFVDEQGFAGKIARQVVGRQPVERGMSTGKSVVERARLAEVMNHPFHRAEPAFPCAVNQSLGHLNPRDSHALASGKGDFPIIPFDETLLDLLLRRRDQRMAEAATQVHGHQRDDLHRLPRARRLLDEHVAGRPGDVGH
jgi:hypothetical protein